MKSKTDISNMDRVERLYDFVEARKRVTIADIADEFAISVTTARRDLDTLADQGRIQRVHGGATAVRKAPPEPPALQRAREQETEKKRIGQMAAELVGDGETVFLGAGTTVLEVASQLRERRGLTVITNSLLVVNALSDAPDINLVVLGGLFRREELSFVGHITEHGLDEVRAAKVIMGVRALDPDEGLTEEFPPEAATNRAILRIGRQVIIVADHTKFGRVAGSVIAPISAMHILVTDSGTSPDFIITLASRGVRVLTA